MSEDERAQQCSISLYPTDIEVLQHVAQRFNTGGRRNLSLALRFIINEWTKENNHDASGTNVTASL